MSDGEILFAQWLLVMGAFIGGVLIGKHSRRALPPPDSRALRSRCEY